ncbi:phosphate propanoyltransferase [Vibrio sp. DW001]|uniref:phosphate propanoyltransferase n=1 Tax=Vibrio sp. DW001 TaxID=2912315 RepID=UPI0023AFAC1F|nr:phosphate propanoyltransferase [Vibrio sp. DW001]WED28697.1 phosphate propanoyltransferase [Vibrio sp. DW001]
MVEEELIHNEVENIVRNLFDEMRQRPIPVGVSNRHIHLCQADFSALFPGRDLTVKKMLLQPGQYAADEIVTVCGPKGCIERVRILGPLRGQTQVEISATDARTIGVKAPLRLSGKLAGTPGVSLVSQFGEVALEQGTLVALRHIHMSPLEALVYGVSDGDSVKVSIEGTLRKAIFDDVAIRIDPAMKLEMHIDTDEANAADLGNQSAFAVLIKN